jgi:hypothetical protein
MQLHNVKPHNENVLVIERVRTESLITEGLQYVTVQNKNFH